LKILNTSRYLELRKIFETFRRNPRFRGYFRWINAGSSIIWSRDDLMKRATVRILRNEIRFLCEQKLRLAGSRIVGIEEAEAWLVRIARWMADSSGQKPL
jgi:hypothetical protein